MRRCFTWDWKAQPDMAAIAECVNRTSKEDGTVVIQLYETGGDSYAITIAERRLDRAQQTQLYRS